MRHLWIRMGYLGALIGLVLVGLASGGGFGEDVMLSELAQAGSKVFFFVSYGQVILADGHLIVTAESGEVVLIRATPERHEELARFSALKGKTWNNPAIVGGRLLVRNTTQMAAYDITSR